MSTMILCKHPLALNPYYIEDASLNVYSLEELCYYMLENVYSLGTNFMSMELTNWIKTELRMNELYSELTDCIRQGAPLHIFAGKILLACGYATRAEIKDFLTIVSSFENKTEAERAKIRGDRLLKKGRLVAAIYEYESLLAANNNTMTKGFIGDVYHNLGVAYAKLFFFDEAVKCFDKAYQMNQRKTSLYQLLYAARATGEPSVTEAMVKRYLVTSQDMAEVNTALDETVNCSAIKDFDASLNETLDLKGQAVELFLGYRSEYERLAGFNI